MISNDSFGMMPAIGQVVQAFSQNFCWGDQKRIIHQGGNLSSAARDSGSGDPTFLRPGLLLGRIAASGLLTNYSPTATDGSGDVVGILMAGYRVTSVVGGEMARMVTYMAGGPVRAGKLFNLDYVARAQMQHGGRFQFLEDQPGMQGYVGHYREVVKTSSYTVVAADAGTLFMTTGASGAVTFTLPTKAAGLGPFEFLNMADQNMTVASAGSADDIVAMGDLGADSIAFSTSSQKIGGRVRLVCDASGTKWLVENLSPGNTITVT